jgi:diguanylate cyclase (GGDEF)-like protein/PAS domain S-box-containing protein
MKDRKQTARALDTGASDYQQFFAHAHTGVYRSLPDGSQLSANPALVHLNGYASEQELLADLKDVTTQWYVDPERRTAFRELLDRDGKVENFESEVYRLKTRERVWVSENAWFVYDQHGQALYYEGTIEDITRRKRFELFHQALSAFIEDSLRLGLDESFYQRLLERTVAVVPGAQAGSILVSDGPRYRFVAAVGFDLSTLQQVTFAPHELVAELADTNPQVSHDYQTNPTLEDERRDIINIAGRTNDIEATLSIPIHLDGETVAFLNLDSFESAVAFSEDALEMARAFAKQVATLLKRLRLEQELRERQHTLEQLADFRRGLLNFMNESLHRGLDDSFYQRLLDQAVRVVPGAQGGSIVLERGGLFHFVAAAGYDLEGLQKVSLTLPELLQGGSGLEPYRFHISHDDVGIVGDRKQILITAGRSSDIQISLSVPILLENTIVGFMYLDNFETSRGFDDTAVDLARIFAEQMAGVLRRFALEDELRKGRADLERWANFRSSLMEFMNETLVRGLNESFYQHLLEHAARVIPGVNAGSIMKRQADDRFHFVAALGYKLEVLQHVSLTEHEIIADYEGRKPRIISNLSEQNARYLDKERLALLAQSGPTASVKTLLIIPVYLSNKVVAILSLDAFSENAFSQEAQDMANAFATQVGILLQRLSLEQALERSNKELAKLASYDTLTELPNRALFADRLEQALAKARRTGASVGVLFLDLDGFKLVNDSLGHSMGDLLLKSVAQRLANCTREEDTVARLGGDEFTIILNSLEQAEDASFVARKVLDCLEKPFEIEGHELHISTSIGVSIYPHNGYSTEELLKNADTAMYHAKTSGKNCYHFFTPELNTKASEQLRLENDLRRALGRNELYLVYQPRVSLQNGTVSSFEALLRWQHPELGNIPPSTFIPVAEKSQLIHSLGREVLRQACKQAKVWQEAGQPKRVAVNLSVRQLQEPNITRDVANILRETQLDGCWLELEITESAAMTDVESNIVTLQTLRDMGIYVSIDDFGTAYSSLNYLKRLPVNSLKIDRSFVMDMTDLDSADHAIVRAVIALGKSLRFSVVAEGVETNVQQQVLGHYGCDEAQGYFFSKPLPASATLEWMTQLELRLREKPLGNNALLSAF